MLEENKITTKGDVKAGFHLGKLSSGQERRTGKFPLTLC